MGDEPKKETQSIDWQKLLALVVSAAVTAALAYLGSRSQP